MNTSETTQTPPTATHGLTPAVTARFWRRAALRRQSPLVVDNRRLAYEPRKPDSCDPCGTGG
jgi:hypothetical protein